MRMRKLLMMLTLLFLSLSVACSKNSQVIDKDGANSNQLVIKKNQKKWQAKIAKADIVHSEFEVTKQPVSRTLDNLKNHNQVVIKGTVNNLEKMHSPKGSVYTKATVQVDRVLSGDESLVNKQILLALEGGLVSFDHWYGEKRNLDREMLIKNDEFLLPEIGSQIITGLVPHNLDEPLEYNQALKESGFTSQNSFAINTPQYNFWVKDPKDSKYQLNNPKLRNGEDSLAKSLQKLTNEINQKYNTTQESGT